MSTVFWVWIAVAVAMVVAEVAQPTSLYWPWTVGAAAAAAMEAFSLDAWLQWTALLLLPSAIIAIRFRIRTARGRAAEDVSGYDPEER